MGKAAAVNFVGHIIVFAFIAGGFWTGIAFLAAFTSWSWIPLAAWASWSSLRWVLAVGVIFSVLNELRLLK